jgi:hypothetical protein
MTKEFIKLGYAVSYRDIAGKTVLSVICSSVILAKANYLNKYFVNIDSTWTPSRVEETWKDWTKIHEAKVLEVYTKEAEF